ncbi:bifunctional UDP-N-acetylglucosamine diphosphorylase/glucosamine-1-phosphate N-acetyltransferase GlmU [Dehalobacterium formicoaceticum]|uniref:bifunctional UDP-N-acetylglucosamine diphosphorylase/glucosamine-1-phosphate N-acetyltransferase GlmU n=1 Tax=Dehalobacterium formicoaceticum TaxID=51515 RepID=UPI000B7CFB5D|nr:bifunctional UDP-N-acetylglucosamine diphosphorylase/glucosamine-1-phosphate N-acetyltransferase GlmU [Dehalobacterium formicoaceticum]
MGYGIILAAGKGTRMRSRLPKVLHKLGGKYMVQHVIRAVCDIGIKESIAVIGHEAEMVKQALGPALTYALQEEQLGTGHAVMAALPYIREEDGHVLVVCGDTPLIRAETLQKLWDYHLETNSACSVLSALLPDPAGYGRIVRKEDGTLLKIVEQKDALPEELLLQEINTGIYCFDLKSLREVIKNLSHDNAQGEYYLTDMVALLGEQGLMVNAVIADDFEETQGINSRSQLCAAEKILRRRKIFSLMEDDGVTIVDPDTTYIDQDVTIGQDTVVEPGTFLRGKTVIGAECTIGPNTDITDSIIGDGCKINRTVMVEAKAGDLCNIGPFAYLRPGAELGYQVKVGDFVEIKKSRIGDNSKIPHLSYVGDAQLGMKVNIGCGTITCNYDGKHKYQTTIEDGVFVGSNTNLVAPVKVGEGAFIGAGSTITMEVPAGDLALGRGRQVNFAGWAIKKRSQEEKE